MYPTDQANEGHIEKLVEPTPKDAYGDAFPPMLGAVVSAVMACDTSLLNTFNRFQDLPFAA